jgi:hypothetical protein
VIKITLPYTRFLQLNELIVVGKVCKNLMLCSGGYILVPSLSVICCMLRTKQQGKAKQQLIKSRGKGLSFVLVEGGLEHSYRGC